MEIDFSPIYRIENVLMTAAKACGFSDDYKPEMRPADPRFGDVQSNGALPYAKRNKVNPRDIATLILKEIKKEITEDLIQISIAGPGFINFTFTPKFLISWLQKFSREEDLKAGAKSFYEGKKVIIDYPSPNTAKQMHVGHLRPMVIGSTIHRLLKFCGAAILSDNHIGDWGTNFGTLIMAIKREGITLDEQNPQALSEIERLYTHGSALEKEDPTLREISRNELVKLQEGDPENTTLWKKIVTISNHAFESIYDRMGIHIDMTLGESFYRDKVERIYKELTELGIAEVSEGALVVFHRDHKRFDKQPFLIRKRDGASNYGSTDLATILYRSEKFEAEEIVYVTDGRQCDHFEQLFLTTEKWYQAREWELPKLTHIWFGTILGENRKALKTRDGGTVKLKELLDEAVERAKAIVKEKNPDLSEEEQKEVAESVGIGAIKYYDLMQNRTSDYVFSWEQMLSFEGNTAPYLLYAGARIHSILRKAGYDGTLDSTEISPFETDQEIDLARKLVAFPSVLNQAIADLRPHFLCTYLYELSGIFSSFYNANKVIVDDEAVKNRRLLLCIRTLLILETGLKILGLHPLSRM